MPITKELLMQQLRVAEQKRDQLNADLNCALGVVETLRSLLATHNQPDPEPEAKTEQITNK